MKIFNYEISESDITWGMMVDVFGIIDDCGQEVEKGLIFITGMTPDRMYKIFGPMLGVTFKKFHTYQISDVIQAFTVLATAIVNAIQKISEPSNDVKSKEKLSDNVLDLSVSISERFPALDPLSLREYKLWDVVRLVERLSAQKPGTAVKNGKTVIRRPAGDTWF